ncbi:MAG: hypothetical protein E2O85_01445 [Bacteroidetes bacterium]|nr:MAG: hypothetical protein E2O85_01445 [Bacteroidota bacterium]
MRAVQIQRINIFWFLTLGVTALAAAFLVYLLLLESALGAFRISEASPANLGSIQRPTIGILESASSRAAYERLFTSGVGAARYDTSRVSWERVLARRSANNLIALDDGNLSLELSTRASDPGSLIGENHDILVLPAALSLSDEQLVQIEEFVQSGGSLLVSWSAGLYDENLIWRGWGFLETTMGIQFDSYVESGPGVFRVSADTFPGVVPSGVYVPKWVFDSIKADRMNLMSVRESGEFLRSQQQAAAHEFAPLTDYVWIDTLGVTNLDFDYATVEGPARYRSGSTTTDGVIVSYYTRRGYRDTSETPFPRTAGTTRRFTFRGNTLITAGIPGGYRAKIQVYNPGVAVRITDPDRVYSAGFWYDFATDQGVQYDALNPVSGLVYGTFGEGRIVFMGFGPDALGASLGDPEDEEVFGRLYDNVLSFLRREPIVWTHDWPLGHAGAVMMTANMDGPSSNATQMATFFENQNVSATVFVDASLASNYPELVSRLYNQGDIGILDPASEKIAGSVDALRTRFRRYRQTLVEIVGGPVTGYRSTVRGALSRNTKEALSSEGYTYFLPDSIGRRTTPKIMGPPFESLTRLGVTMRNYDRRQLLSNRTNPTAMDSLLLPEAYRVLDEGGVFRLTLPMEIFASNEQVSILGQFVQRLRQEKFWFASGSEIAHWWRLRNGLNVSVEQRSKSRIFVRVSNDNGDTAEEATVSIALGESVTSVNIRPELINILKSVPDEIDVPPYVLRENGTVLDLIIKQLKPQQYRIFHIDLVSPAFTARFASN